MDLEYKGNMITIVPAAIPETNQWSAKVIVNDGARIDQIDAVGGFASESEAEGAGLQLAQKWIDDGKPPLTTEYGC
jgi:hypothetical protein